MLQHHAPIDLEWSLLSRYLTGELSPAEMAAVERWFEADPRHRALLAELRAVWTSAGGNATGWDTERTIAELRRRAFDMGVEGRAGAKRRAAMKPRSLPQFVRRPRRSRAAMAAAAAAMLIGAGIAGFQSVSESRLWGIVTGRPAAVTDVTTGPAQRTEVRLADGSRVLLAPASRLSYTADFGRSDRTVVLEGEAYFDVVHDEARPFRVRTAQGIAEDIGTAFVVRSRTQSLQVVVAEGAVLLRPAGPQAARDSVVLTADQLGRVLPDGRLDRVRHISAEAYLAWTRGELAFDDMPLAEVAEELARWYDAEVQVADSAAASRRFSGHLGRMSIEEVVELVAAVADVSVRHTGRSWVFHGRRAP